ncbi:11528_t:CDS:2 [Funneliformis caledonium]|uniref:11528_t:CDS:1 n=1 Tax=Funneliformis caledonium TaxID=1117310 RepID=A0A9N9GH31_9GLOM|nr:11528_t:CDS:2 [Funneliformis caledonium]
MNNNASRKIKKILKKKSRYLSRIMENIENEQKIAIKKLQLKALIASSEEYVERSHGARSIVAHGPLSNEINQVPHNVIPATQSKPEGQHVKEYHKQIYDLQNQEMNFDKGTDATPGTGSHEQHEIMDKFRLQFEERFLNMKQDGKWKLPSGKYVEDIIYEYARNLSYESFIIDISNEDVMNLFDYNDRDFVMTNNILPEPSIDDELMEHLLRYRKDKSQELRKLVNDGLHISPYDPVKHFHYQYVHQVFSQLLPRYELRPDDFTNSHLEGWFTSNVWSIIVDACFIDLQSIEFIRGEGCSRASAQRKNTGRASPKEKAMFGRKCDGIARKVGSLDEYAISEEGRIWNGENGTKYLSDGGLKMPKIMKDMLHQKINKHGLSFVKTHQLEIIGFLHSAQYLQLLVMDIPSWYVCRIQRKPLCEFPKTLVNVDELITIIHEVLVAKLLHSFLQFFTILYVFVLLSAE